MFRLRRFYLDSIGVADNRFSDLTVDLTDRAGEPADSIVWLRNGAGKTTMLSLLLALILPDRRDFLATRTKKRTLEDLVLGPDTSHVVAEWVDPIGQLLLTGAIYEWDNRTRPRDYNAAGKERLRRTWWCVSPDPTVEGSTLDDLPFTLRSKGNVNRDGFRAHVRGLAAQGVNAVVADQSIAEWHRALRERRFDPELFHYFTEVNAAEGGIDGLFSTIDSPGAFVRYLLRFTGDRQRMQPVRDLLAETAVEIAKRPTYLVEQDFCVQAQPRVSALGEAHEKVLTATSAHETRREIAAGYKRALLDAATAADAMRRIALTRHETIEAEHKEVRNTGDSARRRRDEYLRLAAEFRVRAAETALSATREQVTRLRLEVDAWVAVADLVSMTIAQAELEIREAALAAAAEGALPLVEALDHAKSVLATALDNAIAEAETALAECHRRLDSANAGKSAAERMRRAHHEEQVVLDSEQREHNRTVLRFTDATNAAVADGVLGEHERLDAAVTRLTRSELAAITSINGLVGEQRALVGAVEEAVGAQRVARTVTSRAVDRHRVVAGELAALETRAARIGDNARLRILLQADSIDLAESGDDAVALLHQAIAATDSTMVDVRAAKADDTRAVLALETTGLMPPRREVSEVVDALASAGFTAHSGWRYLAENVPIEEHRALIDELPEVVDGVIVYGDPADAAARIEVELDDVVVLSPATVFRNRREPRVVLGPVPARHDPAEAKSELGRRQERLAGRSQLLVRLEAQRRSDESLAGQIEAWVADLPTGGLVGLRRRVGIAADAVAKAKDAEQKADERLEELRERLAGVRERLADEQTSLARLTEQLRRTTHLDTENREEVEPANARLAAIPGLLQAAGEEEAAAKARYHEADELIEGLKDRIRELSARRREWSNSRAVLPRAEPGTELSVEAASAAVREAEFQLRERFPESELRRALLEAEGKVTRAADPWNRHTQPVRARASELAAGSVGSDRELRTEEAARVRADLDIANQKVGAAANEHVTAETELRNATPRGRLRHTEQVMDVANRVHAQRLASEANEEATRIQLRVGQLERDRDAAKGEAERARTRGGMLRDQADRLRDIEPAPAPTGTVPDDDEDIRAAVGDLAEALDKVRTAYQNAASVRSQRADALRTWADDDRFAAVAEDEHGQAVRRLRELFRGDQVIDRVGSRAGELTEDLAVRGRAIGQQLEQVEAHKKNVVQRLAELVDDALTVLRRASTLSELPAGIGPWEHQRFLVVEAQQRPSKEQVTLRVGELVDRMVSGGKIELDAVELLWRATEASVVEGFRATVLKPAPDQPTARTRVEDMRKWSGGENLTASLVLFCVMARLRAEQRTGAKAGNAGGVVPLDNPLGKANYLPFLDLQRRVADASGVQLVFWTGIGDLGAATAFPRIAAMHKRPSATRPGRAYVRSDPNSSFTGDQVVDVVTSVRHDP
ncbi:hypothetical protein [Actinophytocola oryzae]|uniref:Chromosome segregation ATPase n=1 Tax=Actinophytocola oryzae TaxID=502181 RepID=A0A4R7V5V9_9PSEU|nr:hypothetical protein [Actinophytocola oryzae]TDV44204.1 hypothetical protein CLV71_114113 [Actinophytocola oryzae]